MKPIAQFKQAYFYIDSDYKLGEGWTDENYKKFKEESCAIFADDGWQVIPARSSSGCDVVTKDKQSLYLHPMNFSGPIKPENIKYIESLLANTKTFKYRYTSTFRDVYDITDEAYMTWLNESAKMIKEQLLETFKTKRSNLYISSCYYNALCKVDSLYHLERLDGQTKDLEKTFVEQCFFELVKSGEIVTAETKHGTGYRTATKKDKVTKQSKEAQTT